MKFNLYCFDKIKVNKILDKTKNNKNFKDFDFLLKKGHGYEKKEGDKLKKILGLSFKIYYKNPKKPKTPTWLDFVNEGIKGDYKLRMYNKSSSVLILLKLNKNGIYFALTFGSAYHIINKDLILDDFGLKVALNSVGKGKISLVDGKQISSNPKEIRVMTARSTDYYEFGLDELENLLTKLEGLPENFELGVKISGRDSLSFNLISEHKFNFEKLPSQLEKYYYKYDNGKVRDDFSFIDNFKKVFDSDLIDELDHKLVKFLISDNIDYSKISLSLPNLLDNTDIYDISIDKIIDGIDLLESEKVLPYIKSKLKNDKKVNIKKIKDIKVVGRFFSSDEYNEKVSFYKCINFETEILDYKYILNNGIWYQVKKEFLDNINNKVNKLKIVSSNEYKDTNGIDFIPFNGENHKEDYRNNDGDIKTRTSEGKYNEELCNKIGGILLDKNNIQIAGYSKIEVCDVLLDNKFIHVKRGINSSTLSHLFNQGVVSLELFRSYDKYIEEINKKITGINDKVEKLKRDIDVEIIFGIISNGDLKNKIPFFSKIMLLNTHKKILSMGGKLTIIQIKDET